MRRGLRIVEPGDSSAGGAIAESAAPRQPRRRHAFVGREHELGQLLDAFESAAAGRGSLVAVVGEPGIGKTALCEEMAAVVESRGGVVLEGDCYEEGSFSLPYLPFVEAIRGGLPAADCESLQRELGEEAGFVCWIVPEFKLRLGVAPPPRESPDEDRLRLFGAVSSFLTGLARTRPAVLLLEDLHWADQGTLDLLRNLGRALGRSRLLVVATYRDVEVDRTHPLSATLASVRRVEEFARIHLRGLDVNEVHDLLREAAGWGIASRRVAELVHRQTEGNPLFVQETIRHFIEVGALQGADASSVLAGQVPEGLKDVIGRRISRLSPDCNRLLTVAAVIGREFDFGVLTAVADLTQDVIVAAIEEAMRAGVLDERESAGQVRYRFVHAFFRRAFYEETSAPRRQHIHRAVAREIESRYAVALDDHAAELAEHFSHSPDREDLAKAVDYGVEAARRASAVFDYGEAQRLLEHAITVQEALEPGNVTRRSALRISLAHALNAGGEQAAARAIAWQVAETARRARDTGQLTAAARLLAGQAGLIGSTDEPFAALLREVLEALPDGPSADRAWLLARLGHYVAFIERDVRLGATLVEQGLEMARAIGDPGLRAEVAAVRVAMYWEQATPNLPEHHEAIRGLVDEVEGLGLPETPRTGLFLIYPRLAVALVEGNLAEAERRVAEMEALAARYRSTALVWNARTSRIGLLVLEGRLAEARALADSPLPGAFVTISGDYTGFRGDIGVYLNVAIGRAASEERAIMRFSHLPAVQVFLAWTYLRAGNISGAAEVLNRIDQFIEMERVGATRAWTLVLECVASLSPKDVVEDVYMAVLPHSGFNVGGTNKPAPESFGPADRYLGLLATALDRFDDAERHYLAAIDQCERMPSPTFLGESRFNYAEMLLKRDGRGDRAKARQLLAQAILGATEIGHQWLAEHATALQAEASGGSARRPSLPAHPGGLSGREVEVLRLIAAGKTNTEVAASLMISRHTVTRHVSNLFVKIGVQHRADAAAWAVRNGLVV